MKALIGQHRDAYGVEPMCKAWSIAPATYGLPAACQADPAPRSERARGDEQLCGEIRRVFEDNFQGYGADQVWHRSRLLPWPHRVRHGGVTHNNQPPKFPGRFHKAVQGR